MMEDGSEPHLCAGHDVLGTYSMLLHGFSQKHSLAAVWAKRTFTKSKNKGVSILLTPFQNHSIRHPPLPPRNPHHSPPLPSPSTPPPPSLHPASLLRHMAQPRRSAHRRSGHDVRLVRSLRPHGPPTTQRHGSEEVRHEGDGEGCGGGVGCCELCCGRVEVCDGRF
jgi:hypothetical protein